MNDATILLKAYYELLYEKLAGCRDRLIGDVEKVLSREISDRGFTNFDSAKYAAYRDACIAFIDERLESYNPTGIQYIFDNIRNKWAYELEMQLDWYDSRDEFSKLLGAIRKKAESEISDVRMRELAEEIIKEFGAFPDGSIIATYENKPELCRLPDYAVALTIEKIVR